MALSLTAEQKSVKNLFVNEDIYVIPVYQRPYAWTNENCIQLYNDIADAYVDDSDYFVGNLVFARADNDENNPNIIDGQQRIITIWLFIKALSLLLPDMKILERAMKVESWEGDEIFPKIKSLVPPYKDQDAFCNVLQWNRDTTERQVKFVVNRTGKINESICNTHVEANFICIYSYLSEFFKQIDIEEQKRYLAFLMNRVFLLPIELKGKNVEEAMNKALTIFETLNNRGLNLEDADIFKARLYEKALLSNKNQCFIDYWSDITLSCSVLNITLDDLFRYYFHIIRGKNNIITKEKKIREFFLNEDFSPINKLDFEDVISDLQTLLSVLELLEGIKRENSPISAWLKILECYSNLYPKYAVVAYLFEHGINSYNSTEFLNLIKILIRYCYSMGSTTSVKFKMYVIISRICNNDVIDSYYQDEISPDILSNPGRLKKGLALLAHRLRYPYELSLNYEFDNLFKKSDYSSLSKEWTKEKFENALLSLANVIVIDLPYKNLSMNQKYGYYIDSKFSEPKVILGFDSTIKYQSFANREYEIKRILSDFFTGVKYD